MGKRFIIVLLICLVSVSTLFAGGTGFVLDSFDTNGDVLIGFFPTYITSGSRFSMPSLIDGNSTDLLLITGGGYTQRQLWRDETGAVLNSYADIAAVDADEDNRKFNVITGEWKVLFEQGLFWSEATDHDLLTIQLGYKGRYEQYQENVGAAPNSAYFLDGTSTAYTEAEDQLISNTLTGEIRLETVVSEKVTARGIDISIGADYAPLWMLNELLGDGVDYLAAQATIEGYLPLMQIKNDSETKSLFALYVADRIRADYLQGDSVPVYAQKTSSLGHKMRGFESFSYATSMNAVNNFDLRITGPEIISGLFPRAAIFCDVGYYMGHYNNTPGNTAEGLLLSAGGEFAVSIMDFLNAGIRANYAIQGDTLTTEPFSTDIFLVLHY
mgnify:CR=1 FL=1